jgi:hypothetical protein
MRIFSTEFRQDWPVTIRIIDINVCTYVFTIVSRSVVLRMKFFQSKLEVEKIKTHNLFSMTFFFENRAVYEIMGKKYYRAWQVTDDNIIRRRRIA